MTQQNASELSDEQLAKNISRRDASAKAWRVAKGDFEQLYQRHAGKLLAFLSSRTKRSDLDDVHQGIWQRVWERLPGSFQGGNFRAWLYQIARNYLIDQSRKKRADLMDEDRQYVDTNAATPIESLLDEERMQALKRCLKTLDDEMNHLVTARLSGESYDDICVRLDIQPARAHKLFHQAKAQLTTCVGQAAV